jgi:hypothetical protein
MSAKPKPKARKVGRPRKITAAIVEKVGELMAVGMPQDYACALVGCLSDTFGPAVSRNEEFKRLMLVHHARFMARALGAIADGGEIATTTNAEGLDVESRRPWQGLAWILERRYKPHFNRTDAAGAAATTGAGAALTETELHELEKIARTLYVPVVRS